MKTVLAGLVMAVLGAVSASAQCAAVPEPVHVLAYGSRYVEGTDSRKIDKAASRAVNEALDPVDELIRNVASDADAVDAGRTDRAECGIAALNKWAEAGALGALQSDTARLTIGSRIAGMALAARRFRDVAPADPRWPVVEAWLTRLVEAQRDFWETDAPDGARRGNLRAWAALAGVAVSDLTGDEITRGWATWSAVHVACTAAPDGSLPQEMTRGKHALHYQLHAVAPLVMSAVLLTPRVDLFSECGGSLDRAARFAVRDLATGAESEAITGRVQSFFDGSRELGGFQLAWIEAYLSVRPDPDFEALVAAFRPVSNSKLGGNQTLVWR
ncbi:alginate lyase family protein [Pseudaestuariivita atlantica]|uniref:Alginate lyase domain-containing protein n=1 Tax=Pseudaestuariivita atlantica TaxID=1317121 RepID=A0A0L1JNG0_9RHOB|nr:alginate lyase family protein [Pseudaestuariivita atlantica]KNG93294.1 hypothetical protein ATO11_12660 [Pseudaestuariivita atlantica]